MYVCVTPNGDNVAVRSFSSYTKGKSTTRSKEKACFQPKAKLEAVSFFSDIEIQASFFV